MMNNALIAAKILKLLEGIAPAAQQSIISFVAECVQQEVKTDANP